MAVDQRAEGATDPTIDGHGRRVAIVCGRFNDRITTRLLDGATGELAAAGVADGDVEVLWVPGAFEIPLVARELAATKRFHAVITLGCVIRGETPHFDYVAGECAAGVNRAQLDTGVPVAFGVLTTDDLDQALARSSDDDNKGVDSARVALEMAALVEQIRAG
jgi:6,7-dimethyl-8-ribityllumazine synthase